MLQQLALLKGFDLDGLDPTGPEFIHLQIECAKLAFADRETFYGDPKFAEVPIETLLSDAYNDERRKLISRAGRRSISCPARSTGFGSRGETAPPGRPSRGGRRAWAPANPTVGRFGEVRGDTVHFDIIDQAGNMISATPSGGWLQSSPVIPELGFCLGTPRADVLAGGRPPAALAPGKRPRTTLTPDHGAARRRTLSGLGFARRRPAGPMDHAVLPAPRPLPSMNLQEAIDAPAWHSEHFPISFWPRTARPGVLVVEDRVPQATVEELRTPRPYRRGRSRLVGRPPDRGLARRPAPPRRRQPARHAGLRGRTVIDMTWSIIARDELTGQFGIAVATRFFAVGARVPYIAAGMGAIATQALINPYYGIDGLRLLREGRSPARDRATLDRRRWRTRHRQVHVMDADGRIACPYRRRMRRLVRTPRGEGFSVAGNMLTGAQVLDDTARAYAKYGRAIRRGADRGDAGRRSSRRRQARQAIGGAPDLRRRRMVRSRPARRRSRRAAGRTRAARTGEPRALEHFRQFLPTRKNPAGIFDRAAIDAGIEASIEAAMANRK